MINCKGQNQETGSNLEEKEGDWLCKGDCQIYHEQDTKIL